MMKKVLFREEQQFKEGWGLYLILLTHIPLLIFFFYALYQQVVKGIPFGDRPAPNWVLILLILVVAVVLWGSLIMKLEVWIDQEGIHYRFFPVVFKNKLISKAEIQRFEIRKYSPVLDYGGWGIRNGFGWKLRIIDFKVGLFGGWGNRYGIGRKWGKAFIVSGNIGLQLYLTNGKKVLFGTQRSQAIIYAMDEMMKSKPENHKY